MCWFGIDSGFWSLLQCYITSRLTPGLPTWGIWMEKLMRLLQGIMWWALCSPLSHRISGWKDTREQWIQQKFPYSTVGAPGHVHVSPFLNSISTTSALSLPSLGYSGHVDGTCSIGTGWRDPQRGQSRQRNPEQVLLSDVPSWNMHTSPIIW